MRSLKCLLLALLALAPAAKSADLSTLVGVWKGQISSLPAVTLTVEREDGKPTGAILFFLIRRGEDGTQTASAGIPEPLIDPKFDRKTLTFKVSHKHAHPPRTLNDPPVQFRLELKGAHKAILTGREAPPLEMTKSR